MDTGRIEVPAAPEDVAPVKQRATALDLAEHSTDMAEELRLLGFGYRYSAADLIHYAAEVWRLAHDAAPEAERATLTPPPDVARELTSEYQPAALPGWPASEIEAARAAIWAATR